MSIKHIINAFYKKETNSLCFLIEEHAKLADFSKETCAMIRNDEYAAVSNARSGAREFGSSSKIDQVDLVHLAKNMKTTEEQN